MADSRAEYVSLQGFWDAFCSASSRHGIFWPQFWDEWAKRKRESLKEWSAEASFDKLCMQGCRAIPLAITIEIIQRSPSFDSKWRGVIGSARQREQQIHSLEKAATVLESLLSSFADTILDDYRESLDADLFERVRKETVAPSNLENWPTTVLPHPATAIRALREYASILRLFYSFEQEIAVGSALIFSKYLISAYVNKATATFHDPEVSALIGASLRATYDETAHRMWRMRNYERIDEHLSRFADLLVAIGVVVAPSK
jgi:hypothetical protein